MRLPHIAYLDLSLMSIVSRKLVTIHKFQAIFIRIGCPNCAFIGRRTVWCILRCLQAVTPRESREQQVAVHWPSSRIAITLL